MIARLFAASLIVLTAGFTTACGRAPGVGEVIIDEERAVPYVPQRTNQKPKGVVVDGRAYLEGEAPAPFKMPEPGAPEAGKGHIRAALNIKDVTDTTGAISLAVLKGEESTFAKIWEKGELVGSTLATVAENLEPGDYQLVMVRYNKTMGVYARRAVNATVKAGETADIRF